MPDPNKLNKQSTPNNTPAFPWAQFLSRQGWVGSGQFAIDSSSFAHVFDVDGGFLNQIPSQFLGWPQKKGDGTLGRTLPMTHPLMPWMVATRISNVEGVKFTEKHQYDNGPLADYNRYRVTVLFESVPYGIASDAQNAGRGEWNRFTVKTTESASSLVNLDRGSFVFANTVVTPAEIIGKDVDLGSAIPIRRVRLKWKWLSVPVYPGICDSNGIPQNIYKCVNRVNLTAFAGFNPGTLLFEDPQITYHVLPVDPQFYGPLNDPVNNGVARGADVEFSFLYFEPNNSGDGTAAHSGHNLSLWAPQGGGAGWFPIQSKKTGQPLFDSIDFATAFTLI